MSVTRTVSDTATELTMYFYLIGFTPGAISTTGSIYIQYMKLELGSVATPLIPRKTGEELALCQRYYQKSYAQGTFAGAVTNVGREIIYIGDIANSTRLVIKNVKFPVLMKAAPAIALYDVAGTLGRVSMGTGDNIVGTATEITEGGFNCNGTDGASTIGAIHFHYTAISRV